MLNNFHQFPFLQAIQHQVSRLVTEVETAKLLTYNAARMVDARQNIIKAAAMAKYYSSGKFSKIKPFAVCYLHFIR